MRTCPFKATRFAGLALLKSARVAGVLLALACVCSCDFDAANDAFDDFDIIVALEPLETTVSVAVVDAGTGAFMAAEVALLFLGPHASAVVDLYGDEISHQRVEGGLATFGLSNAVHPAPQAAVSLRLVASASGYRTGSAEVLLEEPGRHSVLMRLVPDAASPFAVPSQHADATVDVAAGLLAEPMQFVTAAGAGGGVASIRADAATPVFTESGAAMSGPLAFSLRFATLDGAAPVPLLGSSLVTLRDAAGSEQAAWLAPLALLDISAMDAGGRRISSFGRPLHIAYDLPSGITKADGVPFAAGDRLGVVRYVESDGVWEHAGESIVSDTAGKHPSGKGGSFDGSSGGMYGVIVPGTDATDCTFQVNLRNKPVAGSIFLDVILPGRIPMRMFKPFYSRTRSLSFAIPRNSRVWVGYSSSYGQGRLESPIDTGQCTGAEAVDVIFTTPILLPAVGFHLAISSEQHPCGSGTLRLSGDGFPSLSIWIKRAGTADAEATLVDGQPTWVTDEQGRITGGTLEIPWLQYLETYTFITTVDGTRHERDVRITGPELTLDLSADIEQADLCAR